MLIFGKETEERGEKKTFWRRGEKNTLSVESSTYKSCSGTILRGNDYAWKSGTPIPYRNVFDGSLVFTQRYADRSFTVSSYRRVDLDRNRKDFAG